MSWRYEENENSAGPPGSSATKLARARIGKCPQDCAGVLVHHLAKVHGDGEEDDEKKEVDAKKRMQEAAEVFWREKMHVHPDECGDSQNGEHADDDARTALGLVGVCESSLDKGEFRIDVFGVRLLRFRAHAGFLSKVRCLRRLETP